MKINKHIEIVSSTELELSSMGEVSRDSAKRALEKYYSKVDVTIINSLADLESLVARRPDLVFLGMKYLPVNPELGWQDPEKIWLSDYLEQHEIAYTGSNQAASTLERNKHLAKQLVLDAGLRTSPFFLAKQGQTITSTEITLKYPLFVKPSNRGGGLGIDSKSIVHDFDQLLSKVNSAASELESDSIIEEYLPGREFSVAILRNENTDTFATMSLELIAPADKTGARILSGEVKSLNTERFTGVEDPTVQSKISTLALGVFHALGARDYGRIDIRLDSNGNAHFLEANLLPSLMDGYGSFPKACWLNNQIDYDSMLLAIVSMAMPRSVPATEPNQSALVPAYQY
jgi:D-alanine-D-alanine ligase